MADHYGYLMAVRGRVLGLVVAQTAPDAEMAPTANSFTRAAGSFEDEGFTQGMEVRPVYDGVPGGTMIVAEVTPLELFMADGAVIDLAAPPERIVAGLPPRQLWLNVEPPRADAGQLLGELPLPLEDGAWHVAEIYLPGGAPALAEGNYTNGWLELQPSYTLRLFALAGWGPAAPFRAAQAVLELFPVGYTLYTAGGEALHVRSDVAPYMGQLVNEGPSHASIDVTITLWARTRTRRS